MIIWFVSIGACGIEGILGHPEILKALSPTYALSFMFGHFPIAFFALAAVVLAVTGAEALYADMGHFGRRRDHSGLAVPRAAGLRAELSRAGRAHPRRSAATSAPRSSCSPRAGRGWPMVLLATAATVIASQAVITGAFSVAAQAAQLG